jgi:hypothetical protein
MLELNTHPYTQAVLRAWTRMSEGAEPLSSPAVDAEYPGLVGGLFVLRRAAGGDYPFRRVGAGLEALFGRSLIDHNFLTLWSEADRELACGALDAARLSGGPSIIRARGETLHGRKLDLEFALAPLKDAGGSDRFLGLAQALSGEEALGGRPIRRIQALAVFPPAREQAAILRLVR